MLPVIPWAFGQYNDDPDDDDGEDDYDREYRDSIYVMPSSRKSKMTPEEQAARLEELARQREKLGGPAYRALGASTLPYVCGETCNCQRSCKIYQQKRMQERDKNGL